MSARTTSGVTVRPIRTEADYDAALGEINELMDAVPGTPEGDRLDVLVTLVHAYEARHHPVPPPDPVDAIRFRMEQQGLRPRDLEPYIGTRARVSEVLNRRRALTLPMIRRLTAGLRIPADVLVREMPLATTRTAGARTAGTRPAGTRPGAKGVRARAGGRAARGKPAGGKKQ